MDVEAQDDGVMAKIIQPDGSKSVKVGARIAILADPGDDVSSLEIPPEDTAPSPSQPKQESQPPPSPPTSAAAPTSKPDSRPSIPQPLQKYPLYPSVQVLVHLHQLSVDQIPATGPQGRLLKGDVLAHLRQIPASYPAELSSRLAKLSRLDLSNVKPAPPLAKPQEPSKPKPAAPAPAPEPVPVSVTSTIDLHPVLRLQKKIQDALGVTLPLSTFIARAIELANEDLPARAGPPTSEELFRAVLGLDERRGGKGRGKGSRGHFVPQILALPQVGLGLGVAPAVKGPGGGRDALFDEIVAPKGKKGVPAMKEVGLGSAVGVGTDNIFALTVGKEDERRARVFLERMKSVLEVDPGRLVL